MIELLKKQEELETRSLNDLVYWNSFEEIEIVIYEKK